MNKFVLITAALLAVFSASEAHARNWIVERWPARMAESSSYLKSGEYASALKVCNAVTKEMIEYLGPGQAATVAFGTVLTHKALAHAGLGQRERALWYWHTVLSLYPAFAKSDLSMFGEPGVFLMKSGTDRPTNVRRLPSDDIVPPKLLKRVEPEYPRGALTNGAHGSLMVEVLITKNGSLTTPRVIKSLQVPTLAYASLEALRQWKFEPARVGNEPVDVLFVLTINYKE